MERNGIDPDVLGGMAAGIEDDSRNGSVAVRVRSRWQGGLAVHSIFEELTFAGTPLPRDHDVRTDMPVPLGTDTGHTPGAEAVLGTLGACVATTAVINATRHGVTIDDLEVEVTCDTSLGGLLDVGDDHAFPGQPRVTVRIASPADDVELGEVLRATERTSPTVAALTNPVPVDLQVDRLEPSPT